MPTVPVPVPTPRTIGGGGGADSISPITAGTYSVDGQNVIDFRLSGADLYVQFGDDTLDASTFDPAFAMYYPTTSAFDVEPIGIPVGATKMGVLAIQNTASLNVEFDPISTFAGYGGVRQAITFQATDVTVTLPLNASVTIGATPVHIIARVLSHNTTVDRVFAAIMEASNADNNPRMALRANNATTWGGHYFNSSPTSTGAITLTADVWVTVIASFVLNGANTDVTCYVGQPGVGALTDAEVTAAGAVAATGTYTRLALGGYVNATGNTAAGAGDAVREAMVYVGALTKIQKQQFFEADCPPWDTLLPDPTGIRCWAQSVGGVIFDRTTGETSTNVISTTANITFAAYTGSAIRNHNRLLTQSSSTVLKIPYSDSASGEQALPAMSSCQWRAQAHHILKYDCTTGAADATAAGFATLAAGVSRLYGMGGAVDIDIINSSGAAGDVGTLDLTGVGYSPDLYIGHESGLAYTVTATELDLGGSQLSNAGDNVSTGTVARNIGIFTPNTGSDWPCVVLAVGAGGMAGGTGAYTEGDADSEYADVAAYLAVHGYCVVIVAFADEGQPSPWSKFSYIERIAEYTTLVEGELEGVIGYAASQVFTGGHSGGTRTSLWTSGATYWKAGVETHPGLASPDGGGDVVGCFQFSGPGITDETPSTETREGSWATIEVPIIMFTGTSDSAGEGGSSYYDRVAGYPFVTPGMPKVKVVGNFWTHLYGGLCSVNTSLDKIRAKNQRDIAQNIFLAFCDYCCGRNVAAARAFLESGPDDTQIDYTEPAGEVRYAAEDL